MSGRAYCRQVPAAADLGLILRSRGFRLLLGTRLLSQAADGALQAGLASYVLFAPEREATAGQVATAFAVLLLPYSVVGPFAGVLLDRWRRQRVLVRATLLRAGLVAGLAVLVLRERAGLDVLLLSLLVLGVNRFFLSALSAALPHVVSGRQLVVANALAPTAGTIATTLGAACGLAVRFAAGGSPTVSAGIVAAAAAGYLGASAVARRLGRDQLGPDLGGPPPDLRSSLHGVGAGLVEGLRVVAGTRPAAGALAVIGAHRFVFGVATVMVVLLQRNTFHDPQDADGGLAGVTVTLAAVGVAVPLAAVVTPPMVRRLGTGRWMRLLLVAAGVGLPVLALPAGPVGLAAAGFLLGLVGQGVKIAVDTTLQSTLDDQHRGRVFALYDVVFNVCFVAAAGLAAVTLPTSGRSAAVVLALGAGYLAAAAWHRRFLSRGVSGPSPP
jgi:MFS family permease